MGAESILQDLVNKAKEGKRNPAALTPVAGETRVLHGMVPALFPNDLPNEAIGAAVLEVRRQAQYLIDACDAIDAARGITPTIEIADISELQREKERLLDQRAADIAKRLEGEEQREAVFAKPVVADDSGWQCPAHGTHLDFTSPKGRKFRRCGNHPNCQEFEH